MRKRNIIGALALVAALGGGTAVAVAAPSAPATGTTAAGVRFVGDIDPGDAELAGKVAGLSMKDAGKARALRAPGQQVKALILAPDEQDVTKGDARFERELLVVRHDVAANVDTGFIPVPKGWKTPPQKAVVTVADPATGQIVTVIYIGADEAERDAKFDLAKVGDGRPAELDVPKGLTHAEQVRQANAKG